MEGDIKMQNLGIVTFNDNIDNIIKARQCISSNNIVVFVKEEHERDIQRCNKGTDIHIKFLREIEDYRGKLDMLLFLNAPVSFIYDKLFVAPKIAVTNDVVHQIEGSKVERVLSVGHYSFMVLDLHPKVIEIKPTITIIEEVKPIVIEPIINIEPVIVPVIEEAKQEVIVEAPVVDIEPVSIVKEQTIAPVEEIIEIVEEAILSLEPAVEMVEAPEAEIIEPVVETIKEAVIEAKEMPKKKGKRGKR